MAALKCEICGGKLMAKSGGLFECEYCGMQYDKLRIQEMVQEIKGTVKVEGTVEVTGTVKVEGGANVNSLLKRAWLSIEDKQFDTAVDCFEQVLNIEPELGEAHFGLGMAIAGVTTPGEFAYRTYIKSQPHLDRARKCNDAKCIELIRQYDVAKERLEEKRKNDALEYERQQKLEKEHQAKKEAEAKARDQQFQSLTNKLRQRIASNTSSGCFGICADGTVLCTGRNDYGQLNVSGWDNVIAIACDEDHTIGLKADGTLCAAGASKTGCCDVLYWRNIVKIATSKTHTVALTKDGYVRSSSPKGWTNQMGQDAVSNWANIVDIAATDGFSAGVQKNGQLLYCGHVSPFFDRYVEKFRHNYIAVDAGYNAIVALRENGKVLGCNRLSDNGLETTKWQDVIQVAAGYDHVVGLRKDGTVIATGENETGACNVENWRDIVAICADFRCTMGLKRDGTIVQAGLQFSPANKWRLFQSIDTLEKEETEAKEKLAEKKAAQEAAHRETQRISMERRQFGLCQHCGGELKGFFTKKCVSCGKSKDY